MAVDEGRRRGLLRFYRGDKALGSGWGTLLGKFGGFGGVGAVKSPEEPPKV